MHAPHNSSDAVSNTQTPVNVVATNMFSGFFMNPSIVFTPPFLNIDNINFHATPIYTYKSIRYDIFRLVVQGPERFKMQRYRITGIPERLYP